MLGGGEEFAGAALEIKIRVGAGLPTVTEKVAVKFVPSQIFPVDQGEARGDGGSFCGWRRPFARGGGAAVLFSLPMTKVVLEPA